jgi:hypothetical protein
MVSSPTARGGIKGMGNVSWTEALIVLAAPIFAITLAIILARRDGKSLKAIAEELLVIVVGFAMAGVVYVFVSGGLQVLGF